MAESEICFIAVGMPMREEGSTDLQYVMTVVINIGKGMTHHMYAVDESTVPVETAQIVKETIQAEFESDF